MSGDRLRREVESLLRGDWRHGLPLRASRAPVLGGISIALADHGRQLPDLPMPPDPPPYIAATEYFGWVRWDAEGYPGGPRPPRIYTTSELSSYLAGGGTSFPGGGSDVMWGLASVGAVHICLSGYAPDFTEQPELDSDGSYLWPYESAPTPPVGVPTGEYARLVSAIRGAGRTMTSLLAPTGWGDDPGVLQCWRAPNTSQWWLGKITAQSGLQIVRLDLSTEILACLSNWVEDAAFTPRSLDAEICMDWVLGHVSISDEPEILTIMTPFELINACGQNPIWFGWWGYWQMECNAPAKSIRTNTFMENSKWNSETYTISIDFSGESPGATISTSDTCTWGGALHRVRRPTGSGQSTTLLDPGDAGTSAIARIYTWTHKKGLSWVNRHITGGVAETVTENDGVKTICGSGTARQKIKVTTYNSIGGFFIDGDTKANPGYMQVKQSEDKTEISGSVTTSGTRQRIWMPGDPSAAGGILHGGASVRCGGTVTQSTVNVGGEGGLQWQVTLGAWRSDYRKESNRNGTGRSVCVILPGGGALIIQDQEWGLGSTLTTGYASSVYAQGAGMLYYESVVSANDRINGEVTYKHSVGLGLTGGCSATTDDDLTILRQYRSGTGAHGAVDQGPPDVLVSTVGRHEQFAVMVTAFGEDHEVDPEAFPGLKDQSSGSVADAPWTLAGVRSEWYEVASGTAVRPAGVSVDALDGTWIAPAGCA